MALTETEARLRQSALPAELTSFVGRRDELAEIRRLLGAHRLVTLTGPGGIGKTRLAIHAARELSRLFASGVYLVELAEVDEPGARLDLLADALGMRTQSGDLTLDRIAAYVGDRRLLMLVDNCEHVIKPIAAALHQLLSSCPELHVIATSRQPLGLAGEAIVRVPPLSEEEAVSLFADRAAATDPEFARRSGSAQTVAELCRRLDGIPLAVELAAVRLGALTVEEITARLQDRLRIFARSGAGAPARQQTLRATIDWSYSMLSEGERVLWQRLSIFGGDFGLDAVEAICKDGQVTAHNLIDLMTSLVEKSMVAREVVHGTSRYRLLETLQQYAHELLEASGELERYRVRFVTWVVRLAHETWQHSWGPGQAEVVDRIEREYGNVRQALALCVAPGGDTEAGLQILGDLWLFWEARGHLIEARDRLVALLEKEPPPSLVKARALVSGGMAAQMVDAVSPLAHQLLWQAVKTARELADLSIEGRARAILSFTLAHEGDADQALSVTREAVDQLRARMHDRMGLGMALFGMANSLFLLGRFDQARATAVEGIAICEQDRETLILAYLVSVLGEIDMKLGDLKGAESHMKRSLELRRQLDHRWGIALSMEDLAMVTAKQRRLPRAARLSGISDALFNSFGTVRPPSHQRTHDDTLRLVREGIGPVAAADAEAAGRRMPLDQSLAFALEESTGRAEEQPKEEESLLSKRELQVASFVAQGLSNKQIASRMVISDRTVEAHVQHILGKLGANSRAQIAAWAAARAGQAAVP